MPEIIEAFLDELADYMLELEHSDLDNETFLLVEEQYRAAEQALRLLLAILSEAKLTGGKR